MSKMGDLWKPRLLTTRLPPPCSRKLNAGLTAIRAGLLAVAASLLLSSPALAGGAAGGGSTEVTQILNNVQLAESYAQQVMTYQNQLMQYSTMVRNLAANPLGVLAPDVAKMTNDAARLWSMGKNIASSMSQVDKAFAETFKNPTAMLFADKFANWNNASSDALRSAMLNAGLQRENFSSDQEALQKLVDRVQSADGAVGGLQALGSLNAAQIQESMKLRDLISQQQVAQNTYLQAQASKEQAREERGAGIAGTLAPMPTGSIKKAYTPLNILK